MLPVSRCCARLRLKASRKRKEGGGKEERRGKGEEGKRTDVNLKRESCESVIRLALLLYF